MIRFLKSRFAREEDGNTSVEFVTLFPLVILLFCTAFETSVYAVRQVRLDGATTDVVRHLRLASNTPPSRATIAELVCDRAAVIADCENAITVELKPIDTQTWNLSPTAMDCSDRDGGFVAAEEYTAGNNNQLMMVRICAVFKPLFPTVGLGAQLKRVNQTDYAMVSASAFVNEPNS
jgi:Flp pilus assembly pilin Flp